MVQQGVTASLLVSDLIILSSDPAELKVVIVMMAELMVVAVEAEVAAYGVSLLLI